ncbi:MAG: hypothetical protein NVS2B14_00510 [Chamaesiphon sp.]
MAKSAISRTGSTQWDTLKKQMGDHEDTTGEWARWLFCAAPAPLAFLDLTTPDTDLGDRFAKTLMQLYKDIETIPEQDYLLSPEAKVLFQTWQNNLVRWTAQENHPLIKVAYAKFESYTARIALWLHVVNGALARERPEATIPGSTMQKAIEWTDYYIGQLRLVCALNSPQQELSGKILRIKEFVESKGGEVVGARDLIRCVLDLRGISPTNIREMFKTLTETVPGFEIVGENSKMKICFQQPSTESRNERIRVSANTVEKTVDLVDRLSINCRSHLDHTQQGLEPIVDLVDQKNNCFENSGEKSSSNFEKSKTVIDKIDKTFLGGETTEAQGTELIDKRSTNDRQDRQNKKSSDQQFKVGDLVRNAGNLDSGVGKVLEHDPNDKNYEYRVEFEMSIPWLSGSVLEKIEPTAKTLERGTRVKVGNHHGTLVSQTKDGNWFVKWDKLSKTQQKYMGQPPTGSFSSDQIEVV